MRHTSSESRPENAAAALLFSATTLAPAPLVSTVFYLRQFPIQCIRSNRTALCMPGFSAAES